MTSLTQKSQDCGYNERIVQHNLHVKPDLPPTACQCIRNFTRFRQYHPLQLNSIRCVVGNKNKYTNLSSLDKDHHHHHQWSPVVIVRDGHIVSAAERIR